MAKVKVKKAAIKAVTIKLTLKEAEILKAAMGYVDSKVTDDIWYGLNDAGIPDRDKVWPDSKSVRLEV